MVAADIPRRTRVTGVRILARLSWQPLAVGILCAITVHCTGLCLAAELQAGAWSAYLDCDGRELRFGLDIVRADGGYRVWLVNGEEHLEVPKVYADDGDIVFDIDHYDAGLRGIPDVRGQTLNGWWWRRFGSKKEVRLPFHAVFLAERGSASPRAAPSASERELAARYAGRWAVKFAGRADSSVGVFRLADDGAVRGTFLNTSGDYRSLAGSVEEGILKLSRFDGAHAFHFEAVLQPDGGLRGDFWEGGYFRDTWTARADPRSHLPDPFGHFRWTGGLDVQAKRFIDLDGEACALQDAFPEAEAIVLELFGTWCPNCHDSAEYLMELHHRYRSRGLSVVGLAFEMQTDFEKSTAMVQLYRTRFHIEYPVFLAAAGQVRSPQDVFPNIQGMYAIPTIIFLHGDGRIRAVHTGFTGPAAGEDHDELRATFEALVEELLH